MHIYEQVEWLRSTQLLNDPMLVTESNAKIEQQPRAIHEELNLNLSSQQFKNVVPAPTPPIKPLPRTVSKNYQELAHFINLQIKQNRLDAQTCYPWELDCTPPQG